MTYASMPKFNTKKSDEEIDFYNIRRLQKKVNGLTPIEYRN